MSRAIGPDISFYQDDNSTLEGVNFDVMKAAPSDFVNIRAGQRNWIDPDFQTNWAAAKAAGLPRGSYWYWDSRETPRKQAELWANALGNDTGEIALYADFEESYGGPYGGWEYFYEFLTELELIVNKEILIYTRYYYWKANVPWNMRELFAPWALWAARYNTEEPRLAVPWMEEGWTFWQYTQTGPGPEYGVESLGIDLNYYNGTPEEFRLRFGLDEVDPPTETLYRMTTEESGAIHFDPVETEPEEPPAPEPVEMQLVRKEGKLFCVVHRTPDDGEIHKIQLDFTEGATVKVLPIPKYRVMMRDDGTTHNVTNWETQADFLNLNEVWAFLPIQEVQKSNLNWRMLHTAWTDSGSKGNWDTMGSYILREYLKEIDPPEPPVPGYDFHAPSTGEIVYVNHDWEKANE